jgi:hypothetical protein
MKTSASLLCILLTTACVEIPPGAYYNRGDPENLIDVSSESVHITLASQENIQELEGALRDAPPTRAELSCIETDTLCVQAQRALARRAIPLQFTGDSESAVSLVYERVVARDCENRYIDNSRNNHNLPPATFGCSITGNMVQMVTDKRQFTEPRLMDYPDGEKAVQVYGNYLKPTSKEESGGSESSAVSSAASASQ